MNQCCHAAQYLTIVVQPNHQRHTPIQQQFEGTICPYTEQLPLENQWACHYDLSPWVHGWQENPKY